MRVGRKAIRPRVRPRVVRLRRRLKVRVRDLDGGEAGDVKHLLEAGVLRQRAVDRRESDLVR